jgi:GNAT superfamily N-acetyltransferase
MPIAIRTATTSDATAICDVVRRSIAACCVADHRNELALCYVAPEALHQGVGKGLLRAIESRALSRGVTTLRLDCTRTARDFYVRNGFGVSGPVQVWAGMEGTPMVKHLTAEPSPFPAGCR